MRGGSRASDDAEHPKALIRRDDTPPRRPARHNHPLGITSTSAALLTSGASVPRPVMGHRVSAKPVDSRRNPQKLWIGPARRSRGDPLGLSVRLDRTY
jgi:hypothetical protein